MEQITPGATYPHRKPFISALWLSPYLRGLLVLAGCFVIAIVGIWILGQKVPPPDPFATFNSIFPGQRVDTHRLQAQGYSCWRDPLPTIADISEHCSQDLQTGQFSHITVSIWDGNVKQLTLNAREDALSIGDLIRVWGKPRIHQHATWGQLD